MKRPLHPDQLRAGHLVRDFLIVRRLGVGGFSFVFLVDRAGQRHVLKMAVQSASQESEDRVDSWMRREVASLEALEHPHVLPVLEWGRWPDPTVGYGYFVTPYVDGHTFHTWRWKERAPLYRAVSVLREHLKTLEALHAQGMIHRDIKADNLLVRRGEDTPILIDFGAAHLPGARPLTDGLAPGTLYCQPPEAISFLLSQAAREGARMEARPEADLYAVGVLLYETLTNCRPFSTRLALAPLLVAIASTLPLEPQQLAPGAPASLCALALRLLAKEPKHRPPSARAVYEELEQLLRAEGNSAPWQAAAKKPSECARVREMFPEVDLLEEAREDPSEPFLWKTALLARGTWTRGRSWLLIILALGLGMLFGSGSMLLRTQESPMLPEKGISTVSSSQPGSPPLAAPQGSSRRCALLTGVLGVAGAQFMGCATAPVRPDPIAYLAGCASDARSTPITLKFDPGENASFIDSGTLASNVSLEMGGPLNIKSGPVTATMYAEIKGEELETTITGEAVVTPNRVYLQFNQLHLQDGSIWPICGVAVDGLHQYGLPTWEKTPMRGLIVDPTLIDKSPGSVVLNFPRFDTVLQVPEGYPMPKPHAKLAPPDYR